MFREEKGSVHSKTCNYPKASHQMLKSWGCCSWCYWSAPILVSGIQFTKNAVLQGYKRIKKMTFCCCGMVIMICRMESQVPLLGYVLPQNNFKIAWHEQIKVNMKYFSLKLTMLGNKSFLIHKSRETLIPIQ